MKLSGCVFVSMCYLVYCLLRHVCELVIRDRLNIGAFLYSYVCDYVLLTLYLFVMCWTFGGSGIQVEVSIEL